MDFAADDQGAFHVLFMQGLDVFINNVYDARQCNTYNGRDGTIASRSINTERGSAALVLTRKQKAIARTSDNMLSKVAREDNNLPPRKKPKSSLGYAAEWKLW